MDKLGRKVLPSGLSASDFKYMGRPAKEQGDFGADVGLADCACVNQFGDANNSKYYHGGVVQSTDGRWWVYLEWGRLKPGASWVNGAFLQQDFQFFACSSEAEARSEFAKQLRSKNTARLERKTIAGAQVWAAKEGKDGYLVQSLATRERGLPDVQGIKDAESVPVPKVTKASSPALSRAYHARELELAQALVGGSMAYTRALSKATGVIPTLKAISEVRDTLIPAALQRLAYVGADPDDQIGDDDLRDISKMVFSLIPQQIPRAGLSPHEAILSDRNILKVQQDLDAFESALQNEDFTVETGSVQLDPDRALNAKLVWLDPKSELGAWVESTFRGMTRNRHADLSGRRLKIHNVFSIERPDRDARFVQAVQRVASQRAGQLLGDVPPGLQPRSRPDLTDVADYAAQAQVFLGIHGTRGVNVGPILQTHLRLPKSLRGVQITGAAFGHGIYFATDFGKSWGYTGFSSRWSAGGGNLQGRGAFMFLSDVIGGKFNYPTRAWGLNTDQCPAGYDSVYAHPSRISSLANDEHIIFDPDYCRLRYVVELEMT